MKKNKVLQSMTGFGASEAKILEFGIMCVELRSINHKGLEIVTHLPEGFLSLEHKIRKEIESKIKRGRVTCVLTIMGGHPGKVFINSLLVKEYVSSLKNIKRQFRIQNDIDLNTIIHLPGVLSLVEDKMYAQHAWPRLREVVNKALDDLVSMRHKEGESLYVFLKSSTEKMSGLLAGIRLRFKKAIHAKLAELNTDEER